MFQWKTMQDAGARVRMLDVESHWLDLHVMSIPGKKTGEGRMVSVKHKCANAC